MATRAIPDKKLKAKMRYSERLASEAAHLAAKTDEWLLPSEPGMLEVEGMERTWQIQQARLLAPQPELGCFVFLDFSSARTWGISELHYMNKEYWWPAAAAQLVHMWQAGNSSGGGGPARMCCRAQPPISHVHVHRPQLSFASGNGSTLKLAALVREAQRGCRAHCMS